MYLVKKILIMKNLFFLLIFPVLVYSQTNKEKAEERLKDAVLLLDNNMVKEALVILDECEKLDKNSYIYAYEKAYGYVTIKAYDKAIKELIRAKKFKDYRFEVELLLANCYDYSNQNEKALQVYDEGIKKYPNVPEFEFEKGNYYYGKSEFNKALICYRNAIKIKPDFASAYHNLAFILMNSNDKLSGLVYGEIFVNLERDTDRTVDIMKLMYNTYKENVTFSDNGAKIDFCNVVVVDVSNKDLKMPFCHHFGMNFILAVADQKEINLKSLNIIRKNFLQLYMKNSYKELPNVMVEYLDKVDKAGFSDVYNYYILQEGAPQEFKEWYSKNKASFDKFIKWYTTQESLIKVDNSNLYLFQ